MICGDLWLKPRPFKSAAVNISSGFWRDFSLGANVKFVDDRSVTIVMRAV
jgi:hypothetical protein